MTDVRRARREAEAAFRKGVAFAGEGLLLEAEAAYRRTLELRPHYAPAWFNLGLVYKWLRRWDDSLRCNARAAELDPKDEAAWWNLGTAATAVRDWRTARAAWRGFGLQIPDGDGPIEARFGLGCVRLNPDGAAEVVWGSRLDPVRMVLQNIPLPESGHRWHDVVLHDGEPKGERTVDGRAYPVFDELERWEASEVPTLCVAVTAPAIDDARALAAIFEEHELAAEDWTRSVRALCRACSEGRPHAHHDAELPAWEPERDFGLAAPPDAAERLLQDWAAAAPGRAYTRPEPVA